MRPLEQLTTPRFSMGSPSSLLANRDCGSGDRSVPTLAIRPEAPVDTNTAASGRFGQSRPWLPSSPHNAAPAIEHALYRRRFSTPRRSEATFLRLVGTAPIKLSWDWRVLVDMVKWCEGVDGERGYFWDRLLEEAHTWTRPGNRDNPIELRIALHRRVERYRLPDLATRRIHFAHLDAVRPAYFERCRLEALCFIYDNPADRQCLTLADLAAAESWPALREHLHALGRVADLRCDVLGTHGGLNVFEDLLRRLQHIPPLLPRTLNLAQRLAGDLDYALRFFARS